MGFSCKGKRAGLATLVVAAMSAVGLGASVAKATVLFTDNFNATGTTNTNDLNYNLTGREGGTLGTGGLVTYSSSGNAQVGNTTGNINNGNYLLTAFGGTASPDANFVGSETGPVTISFNMAVNVLNASDTTTWGAIMVGLDQAHQLSFINTGNSNDFGILFRSNGGIQAFQGGSVVTPIAGSAAYWDGGNGTSDHTTDMNPFTLVISGANGTGSGFVGNGTEIQVYAANTLLQTYSTAVGGSLTGGSLTSDYINFVTPGPSAAGTDNLSVSEAVPEPGTLGLLAVSAAGLLLMRRRTA